LKFAIDYAEFTKTAKELFDGKLQNGGEDETNY